LNKIFTGTSGYSYSDWKGNFYPASISTSQYLSYYSSFFNTVELNFTYYRFPEANIFNSMCRNLDKNSDFIFSLKASNIFTHERKFSRDDIKQFIKALEPLVYENRLGSILFQFPYSFYFNGQNISYLSSLLEGFTGYEKCAEFRNAGWLNEETLKCLKNFSTGFCNVDEPLIKGLLPQTSIYTSGSGYIRFHGRNAEKWWNPQHAYQRYDYMYKQEELAEWLPRVREIREKTKKLYVYFNNHYKGKAVKSALMFTELLNSSKSI